jgi:hypothetical protein
MDITVRFPLAVLLLGTMIALVPARADLKLAPQPSTYQIEGVTLPRVLFHDGDKPVTYVPPKGWKYSGSETALRLWPNGNTQAEATITKLPLPKNVAFDEGSRPSLIEQVTAGLPAESNNVQVVNQELNPVRIGGKDTFLVTVSFTSHGDDFTRSVIFLNREQDQIQFRLSCRTSDFPALQKAFLQSQFTWRNL